MPEITNNVSGDIETLVNIAIHNGNIINNGTIYLTAAFSIFNTYEQSEITEEKLGTHAAKYLENLKLEYGTVKVEGIDQHLEFNDFYIPPSLKKILSVVNRNLNAQEEFSDILSIVNSSDYIFIQGGPGSGKTLLLKYILNLVVELDIKSIPIFVPLIDFKSLCAIHPQYSLYDYISTNLNAYGFPLKFIDFLLENNLSMILMDGMDETYTKENERIFVYKQIQNFNKLYRAKIFITSRSLDVDPSVKTISKYQILPFDKDQILQYLGKVVSEDSKMNFLKRVNQMHNSTFVDRNNQDELSRDWAVDRSISLVEAGFFDRRMLEVFLRDKPFPKIVQTPLLLNILVQNYNDNKILPLSKSELLESMVNFLMDKWLSSEQSEVFKNRLDRKDTYALICYIAFLTFKDDEQYITRKRLYHLISMYLKNVMSDIFFSADDLIKAFGIDLGIISSFNADQYKFIHPELQEYLTAQYFVLDGNYGQFFLKEFFTKKRWFNVLQLICIRFSGNQDFLSQYTQAVLAVADYSENVNNRIIYAIKKSKFGSDDPKVYAVFYYLCISLYFNSGERAIYSCRRISHRILAQIYGFQYNFLFALHTYMSELTRAAEKLDLKELYIESLILQLYDKVKVRKADWKSELKRITNKLSKCGSLSEKKALKAFKINVQYSEFDSAKLVLKELLNQRKVIAFEKMEVDDLNILTTYIDLIETYLVTCSDNGAVNIFFKEIFTNSQSKFKLEKAEFSDFLTSFDYSQLSDLYYLTDINKCIDYCNRAVNLRPAHGGFYFSRAATLSQAGFHKEALEDFLIAEFLTSEYKSDQEFQRCIAVCFRRIGDFNNALTRFQMASLLDNQDQISDKWYMAEIYMYLEDYDNALFFLDQIPKKNKDHALHSYVTAYCYLNLRRYDQALEELKIALKKDIGREEVLFIYGYCNLQLENYAEVEKALWDSEKGIHGIADKHRIILLKCFKMQKKFSLYKSLLDYMKIKEIITDVEAKLAIQISPWNLMFKLYNNTNFVKDFVLKYNIKSVNIF